MGRGSDYLGKSHQDIDPQEIKGKINRELITTEELALYLNEFGTYYKKKSIGKKTIENHLIKICKDSNGLLKITDFQINGVYAIDPKFHGLLLTILDTNYFDGRKNKRNLINREELFSDLVENINIYLLEEDMQEIMNNSSYLNAVLESELTKRLSNELVILFRELFHADSRVRYRMMKYVIESISKTRKWISSTDAKIFTDKMVYGARIAREENKVNAEILKEKIRSDSLEEFIIKCLADKVNQRKRDEESDEEEIIGYPTIYLTDLLYQLNFNNNNEIERHLKELDDKLSSQEQYKRIEDKAKEILNTENPLESVIYNELINLCKIYLVAPLVTTKEYGKIQDFIEESMQKDKWDILREFLRK
ncbi:hypothetical protein [Lysinibacillus capsici]|uniref:hypothetical protein n=1 Tax=Lysinibacillus capsici TaxID=2115968 RepID=UPI001CDA1C3A|nr:hypothetical protein [Lysinibacillus capsici]